MRSFTALLSTALLASTATANNCRNCPNGFTKASNNICFKNIGSFNGNVAVNKCNGGDNQKVTDYVELQEATTLLNVHQPVWIGYKAQGNAWPAPVAGVTKHPATTDLVTAKKCLTFTKRNNKRDIFGNRKCSNDLDVICKNHLECRNKFVFEDGNKHWEVEGFPLMNRMTYGDARDFCEGLGGYIPALPTKASFDRAREASCDNLEYTTGDQKAEFWVHANRLVSANDAQWIFPVNNARHVNNNIVQLDLGDTTIPNTQVEASITVYPNKNIKPDVVFKAKSAELIPYCMFECSQANGVRL